MPQQLSRQALSDQELFDELSFYTLAHDDPAFIHENSADAYRAQHIDHATKPIAVVFAVVGLYLYLEKGFTGRQVQRAHMRMAKHRKTWPRLPLPASQASITVADVLATPPGAGSRPHDPPVVPVGLANLAATAAIRSFKSRRRSSTSTRRSAPESGAPHSVAQACTL